MFLFGFNNLPSSCESSPSIIALALISISPSLAPPFDTSIVFLGASHTLSYFGSAQGVSCIFAWNVKRTKIPTDANNHHLGQNLICFEWPKRIWAGKVFSPNIRLNTLQSSLSRAPCMSLANSPLPFAMPGRADKLQSAVSEWENRERKRETNIVILIISHTQLNTQSFEQGC